MRLPTFYEQNLIPNWGNIYKYNAFTLEFSEKGYQL